MPPISKLEKLSRSGADLSPFVNEWRQAKRNSKAEEIFLRKIGVCFKTAYRILGPKTGRQRARDISAKRSRAGAEKGERPYKERRAKELAKAREPWEKRDKELKEYAKSAAKLYRGEMYPEGAPLRAVGF